jgi:hypothetical protein
MPVTHCSRQTYFGASGNRTAKTGASKSSCQCTGHGLQHSKALQLAKASISSIPVQKTGFQSVLPDALHSEPSFFTRSVYSSCSVLNIVLEMWRREKLQGAVETPASKTSDCIIQNKEYICNHGYVNINDDPRYASRYT